MPWNNPFLKEKNYEKAIYWGVLTALISLAFSIRFINSISIFFLVALTIVHPNRKLFLRRAFSNPYFIACIFLFLTKAMGILYTSHFDETFRQASGKMIWVAIPFFFCANKIITPTALQRIVVYFSLSLLIVAIYCLVYALVSYNRTHESSVFYYHALVNPAKHHAVFFSFFLFFCITYWMEEGLNYIKGKKKILVVSIIIFFIGFIILLASKLVIISVVLYLIFFGIRYLLIAKAKILLVLFAAICLSIGSFLAVTKNPVKDRFLDLANGSISLFTQKKFSPDVYFNGLQLRLLIWRFTYEILNEKNAWIIGVSSGDAQYELNRKYIEANVYQGDGKLDNKGYLVFNCHNVFLQTTLESGLIGLFALLTVISILLYYIIKNRRRSTLIFFIAILAFCFTESVLTSQYTIFLFMFFPLLSLNRSSSN